MPVEIRKRDSTRRTGSGASRRVRRRVVSGVSVIEGQTSWWEVAATKSAMEGGGDGFEDARSCLVEAGVNDGPGGEPVAAAAEALGHLRDIDPGARAEADLHAAARLLHEEQADLN